MHAPAGPALRFPYGTWVHTESFLSAYCLSQSGMPPPDGDLLGSLSGADLLGFPGADAQPRLEARLADLFDLPPERALAAIGASGAMTLVAGRLFGPGSTVLTDTPAYEVFRALPPLFGARTVTVERRLEEGWALDPERCERALADADGPCHVFLANPHNPTGAVLPAETMCALADVAARHGGYLVSCEVYMEAAPSTAERVHAVHLAPNTISIGSLTKAYGLGPARVGWLLLGEGAAPLRPALLDAAYLAWSDPPTASLALGLRALDHLGALLQPLRQVERHSRPHLHRWLRETPGVAAVPSPFGILEFARLDGVRDTRAFQRFLAAELDVDVGPGEFFGLPGHVRLGCGVPEATLVEGLVRLSNGLRMWRERGE